MASVLMTHLYPEGQKVTVQVWAESSYPDALDQARATCTRAFRDAMETAEATRVPVGEDET